MRLRRGRLCFRRGLPQHRLRVCPFGLSDHLRRPRDALRLFRPFRPAEDSRSRFAAGAQIITGGADRIAYAKSDERANRDFMHPMVNNLAQ